MNFKKSLTEKELGVILAPQLRLFLSVDVVGSTAFKHRKALDGESKPWLKFIHGFYTGFPEMCWRQVTERQAEAPPKTILAKPYLWKALGDELIFSVPLHHPSYARHYLQAFRLALVEAIEHWTRGENPLPLFWIDCHKEGDGKNRLETLEDNILKREDVPASQVRDLSDAFIDSVDGAVPKPFFHGEGISSRFQPPPDFAARLADAQREIGKIYDITYPEFAVPADSGEMAGEVAELLKEVKKAKPNPAKSPPRPPKRK